MADSGIAREMAERLISLSGSAGLSLAVAESCTGGLVGAAITAVSGSSGAFRGGVIAYENAVKITLLGVSEQTLRSDGAVSRACAVQMADGVRSRLQCDLAVSITGIAGPSGGTVEKPVGTVWIAVSTLQRCHAEHHVFAGDREAVRAQSVVAALESLLRAVGPAGTSGRTG
jgi:PncC family amidohydrolase